MTNYLETRNPYTEEVINTWPFFTRDKILESIDKANQAYSHWRTKNCEERGSFFTQLAFLLRSRVDELAALMAIEMGKPVSAGRMEIEKCAWCCEHFAKKASDYLQPQSIATNWQKTTVYYEPLGVILAIMPWNYPFWQVFRCVVPALMAGNTVLLKHAPNVTGCGALIVQLFHQAGFPNGIFQQLLIDTDAVESIVSHSRVSGLSFTGSVKTGRLLAALTGKYLKKAVLELGGSDPYLILEDADLDLAAQTIVAARLNNAGQVCIAPKRVIVINTRKKDLEEKILKEMEAWETANPMDENTRIGPMARADLRDLLHRQVLSSLEKGAIRLAGGELPPGKGYFYPPTLLSGVKPGMAAFDEELFGPVIAIISASDEEEAIRLANLSPYGLGAAVFTKDLYKGEKIGRESIEAGSCFVNLAVTSDPRLPFGGIKDSGLGRELGREGILEFVNIKTVAIR